MIILSKVYSTEELQQLADSFTKLSNHGEVSIFNVITYYFNCLQQEPLQQEPSRAELMDGRIPLEELPLLINHKDKFIVSIVKWRLEIGK